MNVTFHTDPDGELHIAAHGVSEREVLEVLARPLERTAGRDESILIIGRSREGRVLKIVAAVSNSGDGIFVITAYDLPRKQVRALNSRLRRRGRR